MLILRSQFARMNKKICLSDTSELVTRTWRLVWLLLRRNEIHSSKDKDVPLLVTAFLP